MMPRAEVFSDTTNIAALSNVTSSWINIGKQTPDLFARKTSTGGTYALEIEWSRDGGSTQFGSTDTIVISNDETTLITAEARWFRARVKNTHATVAFSAHSTTIDKDMGSARR